MRELQIVSVTYHRNGITGTGFWGVRFFFTPEGESWPREFLATMEYAGIGRVTEDQHASCRVVDLHQPENTWRGDRFANQVAQAIRRFNPWKRNAAMKAKEARS